MDNRYFWNERYVKQPELGSGPGSRGYAAWYKQELIRAVLRLNPVRSILDLGCGDLCWLASDLLKDVNYTGVDISDVIVAKNRQAFPSLRFISHDLSVESLVDEADLVVCFDVLIHQIAPEAFQATLKNILLCVAGHGLISYLTPGSGEAAVAHAPELVLEAEKEFQQSFQKLDPGTPRARTAFHGPLPDCCQRIDPAIKVRPLAAYRGQTIYEVARSDDWLRLE